MSLFDQMKTGTNFDAWLTNDGSEYVNQDRIDARVRELTSYDGQFTHRTYENFCEVINSVTSEEANTISDYMSDPIADLNKFGLFIKCLIINKLEDWAIAHAENEENNNLLGD